MDYITAVILPPYASLRLVLNNVYISVLKYLLQSKSPFLPRKVAFTFSISPPLGVIVANEVSIKNHCKKRSFERLNFLAGLVLYITFNV